MSDPKTRTPRAKKSVRSKNAITPPTEGLFLVIDPGKNPGYAVVRHLPGGEFRVEYAGVLPFYPSEPHYVICESQVIRGRVNPKSLVTLAFDAGRRFGEAMSQPFVVLGWTVTPESWKDRIFRGGGRIAKEVFTERLTRWLQRNTDLEVGGLDHNVIDAIGIGLSVNFTTVMTNE